MLTITTGLTGKVWQCLNGRSSVSGRAFVFCDRYSRSPREIDAIRSSRPSRLLRKAVRGRVRHRVDHGWRAGARRTAREDFR